MGPADVLYAVQEGKLHQGGEPDHGSLEGLDQVDGADRGRSGSDEVVDDQDALPAQAAGLRTTSRKQSASWTTGVMSLKPMPGLGKSLISRIVLLMSLAMVGPFSVPPVSRS